MFDSEFRKDVWLVLITIVVLFTAWKATQLASRTHHLGIANQHEISLRSDQFCTLVAGTHIDRVKRYRNTVKYLKTPTGRLPTPLNVYIRRASLPQSKQEVEQELRRFPKSCLDHLPKNMRGPGSPHR